MSATRVWMKNIILPSLCVLVAVPFGAALLAGSFKQNMLVAGVVCASVALLFNIAIVRQFHGGRLPKDPPKGSLLYRDWNDWWAWFLETPRFESCKSREILMLFNQLKDESARADALEQAKSLPNFPKMAVEAFGFPFYDLDVFIGKDRHIHTLMHYWMRYPRYDKQFVPITFAAISVQSGELNIQALDLFLSHGAQINDADIQEFNVLEALADVHLKRRASPFGAFDPVHLVPAAIACQGRGIMVREEALAKFREMGGEGRQVVALFEQKSLEATTAPALGAPRRAGRL